MSSQNRQTAMFTNNASMISPKMHKLNLNKFQYNSEKKDKTTLKSSLKTNPESQGINQTLRSEPISSNYFATTKPKMKKIRFESPGCQTETFSLRSFKNSEANTLKTTLQYIPLRTYKFYIEGDTLRTIYQWRVVSHRNKKGKAKARAKVKARPKGTQSYPCTGQLSTSGIALSTSRGRLKKQKIR